MGVEGDGTSGPGIQDTGDAFDVVQFHTGDTGSDTIKLVFTGEQLSEFLSDPALHGELADWLTYRADPVMHDPALTADVQTEAVPQPHLAAHPALVIYGAPASIDVTPANDEAGYAFLGSDPGQLLYSGTDGALNAQGSENDALLGALSDDWLHGTGGEDMLETATRLAPQATGGDANTFLVTRLNIADLIGDYDQVRDPGVSDRDAALFDHYLAAGEPAPHHPMPGTITIEIEDGSATAATHILI